MLRFKRARTPAAVPPAPAPEPAGAAALAAASDASGDDAGLPPAVLPPTASGTAVAGPWEHSPTASLASGSPATLPGSRKASGHADEAAGGPHDRLAERPAPASAASYAVFDHLAIMIAVVREDGTCLFANSALEGALGQSRRKMLRGSLLDWFVEPDLLRTALPAAVRNEFSFSRLELQLRRPAGDPLPVQATINAIDNSGDVLLQMIEAEQESRQEREQRALGQAQANKELIRNLAHEIKNPLGGIRGAAQLLEMEVDSRELTEYTQVIIQEADRLQALVDRLLAPHRKPHVVSDVNIHEVCERVRSLILAEFPRGLCVERDYDISIPDFCGDREQLIQAVLNIAHNAAHALVDRIAQGDAVLRLHTRIRRQVTLGKQRYRLALELHIADNGPGVLESIRDRIFYPLVSGREGGSGLGLTLAQTFVQQHQGTIECESEPGNCVFKIVIPFP